MKLNYNISVRNALYIAQLDRPVLTPNEEEKVRQFGEPFIQTGGTFTGTVSRPGCTTTTIVFTGGGGAGATGTVVLNGEGGIQSVTVLTPGSGYASLPAVVITGVGVGASIQAVTLAGAVTGATVLSSGYGYQMTPVNVSFTLPSCLKRLLTDFPIVRTFSLDDTYDADAQAQVWVETVETNMIQGRNTLLTQLAPLEGENLQTV